jgi:hypothetical protein
MLLVATDNNPRSLLTIVIEIPGLTWAEYANPPFFTFNPAVQGIKSTTPKQDIGSL